MTDIFSKATAVFIASMAPVAELRGGIPLGAGLGLPAWQAYLAAVAGNMVPVPFIILFIRRIFLWLGSKSMRFQSLVEKLETKARLKGRAVRKYRHFGLVLLVAVPLPGTGAWTGALAAAFLDMRLKDALRDIFIGVLAAGAVVSCVAYGAAGLFA